MEVKRENEKQTRSQLMAEQWQTLQKIVVFASTSFPMNQGRFLLKADIGLSTQRENDEEIKK